MQRVDFYTSVSGVAFLRQLGRCLGGLGYPVDWRSAVDEKEYRNSHTLVQRLALRWRMHGGFLLTSAWKAARDDSGVRVITTNPFYMPAFVQWRTRECSGPNVFLLYDLYPDVLEVAGKLRRGGIAARIAAQTTRYALRHCAATVFLGKRLRQHAEETYGAARLAAVIPVGADGSPFASHRPSAGIPDEPVEIFYSGNFGRMHDFATVGEMLRQDPVDGIRWRFQASGAGYVRLQQSSFASAWPVEWGGGLDDTDWIEIMRNAQVALITLRPGAEKLVMPSKTYSSLVAGQAILAICNEDSELADLVLQHDCGWVIPPGDSAGLRKALLGIRANPAELQRKRENAFRAGHAEYDMPVIARQWASLFDALIKPDLRAPTVSVELWKEWNVG